MSSDNNKYDLTFATASETFVRLVQIVDGNFYDGKGNFINESIFEEPIDILSLATQSEIGFGLAADVYAGFTESNNVKTFNIKGIRAFDDSITITQDDDNVYIKGKTLEPPTAKWELTNINCFGSNNGQIVIETFGGNPEKKYSINGGVNWNPIEGLTTSTVATFSNLTAGNYTLVVFDSGLGFNTLNQPVTLTQPSRVNFTRTIFNATTNTQSDGKITISASGGTAPYEYSINGGSYQISNVFNNLTVGNYTILVKDSNGCLSNQQTVTISGPPPISISNVTVNNPTCPGGNGTITISVSNGSGKYRYSTDGGSTYNGITSNNINVSRPPGNYNIKVKDFNTDEIDSWKNVITIINPIGKSISEFVVTNGLGGSNASIFIEVQNVVGTPRWSISNNTFTNFTNNLVNNTWTTIIPDNQFGSGTTNGTVIIRDNCSIDLERNFNIIKTSGISVTLGGTIRPGCPGDNWIYTFNASGGSGDFQYSLDNISWLSYTNNSPIPISQSNSNTISNTPVYFRDTNNTINFVNISVRNSAVTNLIVTPTLNLAPCSNGTTTLSVSVSGGEIGGNNQYQYQLFKNNSNVGEYSNNTNYTISGDGQYKIRARRILNGNLVNCFSDSDEINITLPKPISVSLTPQNATSCGENGNISVDITGGTSTYQYKIDNNWISLPSSKVISLSPGQYSITFRDSNNCQSTSQNITISGPVEVDFSSSYIRPLCNGGTATINITPNKGTGPFTITPPSGWTTDYSGVINLNNTISYTGNPTTQPVSFTVTDNANCKKTKPVTVNGQPLPVTLTNIGGVTGGGLTGNISGGTSPYRLEVINSANNNQINGSPFNVNQSINLNAGQVPVGSYRVTGIDSNNCRSAPVNVVVNAAPPPSFVYFFKFNFTNNPNIFRSNGRNLFFGINDNYFDSSTNDFALTPIGDVVSYYINNLQTFHGGSVDISNRNNWNSMDLILPLGNFNSTSFNVAILVPTSKNFPDLVEGSQKITDINGSIRISANSSLKVNVNTIEYTLYNVYGTSQNWTTPEKIIINNS